MVVLTIFLKNTVLLNNPKFQKGISITSNGSPLFFLIYIRHQMKWALQVVTPFILSKIKLDSLTKKEFTGKTCYIQNNDITKFMYTLGCPKAPPPPSQDTTLLSTWLTGCSAIKSIAKFLFTCKKKRETFRHHPHSNRKQLLFAASSGSSTTAFWQVAA